MRKSLRELAHVEYGASPSLVRSEDGRYPIYGTGGIQGSASRSLFDCPITVVGRKGTLGNPLYSAEPCWVIDTAYGVIAKPDVDAKWLYFNLARFDLASLNEATGVPSINRNYLYRIEFWSPHYRVQRRIAEILTTVDNQIEKTEALIAKYQSIKQGLMHDLFTRGVDEHGRLRPTRDEAPQLYKESRFGPLPKDWFVCPMAEVCTLVTDGAHQSVTTSDDGTIPFLYVSCVREGRILWTNAARISQTVYRVISRGKEPERGDVLYTAVGSYGFAAAVETDEPFSFQRHIAFIQPNRDKAIGQFLAYWLNHPWARNHADAVAVGNAQKTITLGELKRFPVIAPSLDEQKRIVARLNANDAFCDAEANRLAKLKTIKLGLMQDLLTGKVPVKPEHRDQDNGVTSNGAAKAGVKPRAEGVHA